MGFFRQKTQSPEKKETLMDSNKKKTSVAILSVISNTTLVVLKLVIGIATNSVSVISESIHSAIDLLAALIAYFAVKTSGKPADKDHPYGHGKFENMSGTVEAALIFLAAGWIIIEAIQKFLHPVTVEKAGWGVGIMLFSSIVNWLISKRLFRIGQETDSVALQADGWHLMTDVYTSAGVMAGLAVIWFGETYFPKINWQWVDPLAALGVALLIVKAAYDLTLSSAKDLLDVSLPEEEENWIHNYVLRYKSSLRGFHRLRTRKSGSDRFIEFHLIFKADTSVEHSHRIGDQITGAIKEHFPGAKVIVHIEPCDWTCKPHCVKGCLLTEAERERLKKTELADKDQTK